MLGPAFAAAWASAYFIAKLVIKQLVTGQKLGTHAFFCLHNPFLDSPPHGFGSQTNWCGGSKCLGGCSFSGGVAEGNPALELTETIAWGHVPKAQSLWWLLRRSLYRVQRPRGDSGGIAGG